MALGGIFSERPALHRYPKAMAARVQDVARLIVDSYDGDPERLWTTAKTGSELLKRVSALPGFGAQKAQIFVALLGKQFGVRPRGWREAAGQVRGQGLAPVGRGHLRRRLAGPGAVLQAGAEGRGQGPPDHLVVSRGSGPPRSALPDS